MPPKFKEDKDYKEVIMKLKKGLNKINKKGGEIMKRFLILAMVIGFSMTIASSAFAGIQATRHNLSKDRGSAPTNANAGGTSTVVYSTDQDQLCVWCHTPHAAIAGAGVALWNKTLTTGGAGFTTYPTTVAGTAQIAASAVNSASKICLTCHDGTLAISQVINAPGPGGITTAITQFGVWQGLNAANNFIPSTAGGGVNIGIDLSNDHPISIIYSAPSATSDNNPANLRATTTALTVTTTSWLSRKMGDTSIMAVLVGSGATATIECVSCHEPHTSVNALFLRATTSGSKICTTCHDK